MVDTRDSILTLVDTQYVNVDPVCMDSYANVKVPNLLRPLVQGCSNFNMDKVYIVFFFSTVLSVQEVLTQLIQLLTI